MDSKKSIWTNNAFSTLASGISSGATSCSVQSGHGTRFPSPTASQLYRVTFRDATGNVEVCTATGRTVDTLTGLTRGLEGTTARAWASGDKAEVRLTAGNLAQFVTQSGQNISAVAGGTVDAITATFDPPFAALIDQMEVRVRASGANSSTTPTFSPDTLPAKTIVKGNNQAVVGGDIPGAGYEMVLRYQATWDKWVLLNPGTTVPHESTRQTVVQSALNANGQANYIAAGTGLACNLAATATPVVASFAAGEDEYGQINYRGKISADVSSYWSSLPANNLSFLGIDRDTSTGALTALQSLLPPQYGYSYDRTKQALLHFEGSDTSTSMIDDYGNTWTAAGNAQIDTAQSKFGASSLLLDGTGDYVSSTSFTSLGDGSWTMEGWFRWNDLTAGAGLMTAQNAGSYGAFVAKGATAAGVLIFYLSSNGSSWDIASGTAGSKTDWVTGTQYHIAFTFDSVAGKYVVYVNGVQDISFTSTSKICAIASTHVGKDNNVGYFNGWIDEFRFSPCCRYPNGTTFTPSASAFAVEGHYFSIPEMKMYEATSASASAGTNPGMTARQRVFAGEATTGAASVSAVTNYALRGESIHEQYTPANGTSYTFSHNIGTKHLEFMTYIENKTAEASFVPGERTYFNNDGNSGTGTSWYGVLTTATYKTVTLSVGNAAPGVINKSGGQATFSASAWKAGTKVRRAF